MLEKIFLNLLESSALLKIEGFLNPKMEWDFERIFLELQSMICQISYQKLNCIE